MNNKPDPTLNYLTTLQSRYDKKLKDYEMTLKEYQTYKSTVNLDVEELRIAEKYLQMAGMGNMSQGRISVNADSPSGTGDSTEKEMSKILNKMKKGAGLELMPDKVFWGQGRDKTRYVSSPQECRTLCEKSKKCTGASFIPFSRRAKRGGCYLRTGMGNVRTQEGSTAIVNKFMVLVAKLKYLNTELISINQKIMNANTNWQKNDMDSWRDATYRLEDETTDRHNELLDQREIIDNLMIEYDSATAGMKDTDLGATQNLLWYRIYFLILIIILVGGVMLVMGVTPSFLTMTIAVIFSSYFLGFHYLALILTIIYILYYLYSIPI
mgnify:CR=1 FL=1